MKVLSLFDGISCGMVALKKLGIEVTEYHAFEIDNNAIKISENNYPEIIRHGDVTSADFSNFSNFDLLLGGSPCQDLSISKRNREGLKGSRSSLFWYYVEALRVAKPKYFLFENVGSMSEADKQIITESLGVEPILVNSALVSAQQRKRWYWTNIPNISQPTDKGIVVADIIGDQMPEENLIQEVTFNGNVDITTKTHKPLRIGTIGNGGQGERVYSIYGKTVTLAANGGGRGAKTGLYLIDGKVRKLTPIEAERAQNLPDNYTIGVSDTARYKAVGNGWTVDVIAHLLEGLRHGAN